jgi:hypothetical protein
MAEEEGGQVISRGAEDIDLHPVPLWRVQSGANIPLAAYISDYHLSLAGQHQIPQPVVQFSGLESVGIDLNRSQKQTS